MLTLQQSWHLCRGVGGHGGTHNCVRVDIDMNCCSIYMTTQKSALLYVNPLVLNTASTEFSDAAASAALAETYYSLFIVAFVVH